MTQIEKHLTILGKNVQDKVTKLSGVATLVCFDLYGCIQVCVNPGLDKAGTPQDSHWYDIARLRITSDKPVMPLPDFMQGIQVEGRQGPAEKPAPGKP